MGPLRTCPQAPEPTLLCTSYGHTLAKCPSPSRNPEGPWSFLATPCARTSDVHDAELSTGLDWKGRRRSGRPARPPAPTGLMPQTAGQGQSLHRGPAESSRRRQHSGWAHEDAQNWGGGCLSKENAVGPAVWQQTYWQGPGPRREASASTRGSDTRTPRVLGTPTGSHSTFATTPQ